MVHTKRIEMRGFKSFGPKKVTINLDKGITTITGPNGSGKTNIIDAIRFVLGEMSVRSLRADKMAEVIFDGTPKVKGADSAYVSMTFDNSDRYIPVDSDTVKISRVVKEDGTSDYRINGKKVLRSNLVDILGVAGLNSSGHNIIMQGTITRIADFTPNERRGIIEDMIGIAEYDAKKASANEQLQQANLNLRVAAAKIGEVQNRLESLEIERNDAQRYNFIQSEIKRMQSAIISKKISNLKEEVKKLTQQIDKKKEASQKLKRERSTLIKKRAEAISQRKKFEDEFAKKGGKRLLDLEKTISDKKAQVASLKMSIESAKMRMKALEKNRDERSRQFEELNITIKESNKALKEQRGERNKTIKKLNEKKQTLEKILEDIREKRRNLYDAESKIDKLDEETLKTDEDILKIKTGIKEIQTKQSVLRSQLRTLNRRREDYQININKLKNHIEELQRLAEEEEERLSDATRTLEEIFVIRDRAKKRLFEAEKTEQRARILLNEYALRRDIKGHTFSDDETIRKIEQIAEKEKMEGVYGRLGALATFDPKYRKALDFSSNELLNAMVVKDLDTALNLLSTLKRLKIGRLKIIPVKELTVAQLRDVPEAEGVLGYASNFIKIGEKNLLASIFKDTLITTDGKTACKMAKEGFRAVDLDGDVYDEGGVIEGGYYEPSKRPVIPNLDLDEFDRLQKNVDALETMLEKRNLEIDSLEDEMKKQVEKRVLSAKISGALGNAVKYAVEDVERFEENLIALDEKIVDVDKQIASDNAQLEPLRERLRELSVAKRNLSSQRERLKPMLDLSPITKQEELERELEGEINELERRLMKISGDLKFIESNLDTTLKPEYVRARLDIKELEKQTTTFRNRIQDYTQGLQDHSEDIAELESARGMMYDDLASVRTERKKYEDHLQSIEFQLNELDSEYEPLTEALHKLDLKHHEFMTEMGYLNRELANLGCGEVVIEPEEFEYVEPTLINLQKELQALGSVNQLSIYQYDGLKNNYKNLSIRINQLEEEKKSIMTFIEELEKKKRATFMTAYNNINSNFKALFSRLTGGGDGWLQLQNTEDPLSEGIDVFVQFPSKSPRLVAGASGGEKSVVAVSFILALQRLSTVPFYIFDEIDAHLDSYNAERLADLLVDESQNSQFIVITLRDVMINRFEKIFGVYSDDGVSKVISLDLEEVPAV